jgi:hypothetical protein
MSAQITLVENSENTISDKESLICESRILFESRQNG